MVQEKENSSDSNITEESLSITEKLNLETAKVVWKELEIPFARGVVIVVSSELDLIEAAVAFHEDNQSQVAAWLDKKLLQKPELDWVKGLRGDDEEFWAVVVAPFVLIQSPKK